MSREDVRPGAEAFSFDGGPAGILIVHGYTGSPAGVRPVGEWLAARGHAVEGPRLPGHGTTDWSNAGRHRWQDWEGAADAALERLAGRCEVVVALGLSFGGAIALRLAAIHPERIDAVAVVNPFVRDTRIAASPVIWPLMPSVKGVINDIKKGGDEVGYERLSIRGLGQVARYLRRLRPDLPRVRQPVVVFSSAEDHVVQRGTAAWLMSRLGSSRKELIELPNSYHVATLDHDAEQIFERTHELAEAALREHSAS